MWDQNVSLSQIKADPRILGIAVKQYGKGRPEFLSEFELGRMEMLHRTRELLNDAGIVVTYNGQASGMKWIAGELAREGFAPPSPYKQVDLFRQVKANFRFPSNELDYVGQALGLGGKVQHQGFALWKGCLDGDPKAWATMARCAKGDIILTEKLYDRMRPWIKNHPHYGLYANAAACTNCGHTGPHEYHGLHRTSQQAYDRFRCKCGTWLRGNRPQLAPREYRQAA